MVFHVVSCSLLMLDGFLMLFGSRWCSYIKLLSSQSQDWPYWTHKLQTVWQLLSIFKPCNQRNGVRQNQHNEMQVMSCWWFPFKISCGWYPFKMDQNISKWQICKASIGDIPFGALGTESILVRVCGSRGSLTPVRHPSPPWLYMAPQKHRAQRVCWST